MKSQLSKMVIWFRHWSICILCVIIIVGLLAIFIIGAFSPQSITLSMLNDFSGIVLGITATLLSVVSLVLSFYNLEKSEDSEKSSVENMRHVSSIQEQIKDDTQTVKIVLDEMQKMLKSIEQDVTTLSSDFSTRISKEVGVLQWGDSTNEK